MSTEPEAPARPRARRGWLFKLGLACASLTVALLLAELWARAFWRPTAASAQPPTPDVTRKSEHRHLTYELCPLARDVVRYPEVAGSPAFEVEYRINADGFRDELYARPKPAATYRIAVLGDSFTFGAGVRAEEAFAKVAERCLREEFPGRAIEVMNCGVHGYNTHQEVGLLHLRVLDYEPDMVVLCYFMNDIVPLEARAMCYFMNDIVPLEARALTQSFALRVHEALGLTTGDPEQDGAGQRRVQWWLRQPSVLADHLADGLDRWLRGIAFDQMMRENWGVEGSPGWQDVRFYLTELARTCKRRGIALEFLLYPSLARLGDDYPWRAQHRATARRCAELGIPFHDLLPVFVDFDELEIQVHPIDHHPNVLGQRLAGEFVAAALRPAIERALAEPAPAR